MKASILLLCVSHSRCWFGGQGRGQAADTHMVIHRSPHPFANSVYVCVCSHLHTNLLTHSAWNWQYLWQQDHLVFEPEEGCAYLFL